MHAKFQLISPSENQFREDFRDFRPDSALAEPVFWLQNRDIVSWQHRIVSWPHRMWPGHIVAWPDCGLATLWPGHSVPLWESHSQGVRAGRDGARVKSEGSPGPGVPGAPGPGGRRQAADLSGGLGGRSPPSQDLTRTQERFPAAAGRQV